MEIEKVESARNARVRIQQSNISSSSQQRGRR